MNISASIIDYNLACLEKREIFALTQSRLVEFYEKLKENDKILGSVVISTCNRTEIYLNLAYENAVDPFEVICDFLELNSENFVQNRVNLINKDAIFHLFQVASGLKSQIWGEDQIISQVKNALILAREQEATDGILEVLFRNAISGAKKVKSEIDFKTDNNSTAKCAANIILKNEHIKSVLIIGNGEIGRLTAEILASQNIKTTMTLRQYKYKENIIPSGVDFVSYGDRYEKICEVDAVVSATSSPHFTIEIEKLAKISNIPDIFIDLAVPRDIDPKIEKLEGVLYYNIDNLDSNHIDFHKLIHEKKANKILSKYVENFYKWYEYKMQVLTEKK